MANALKSSHLICPEFSRGAEGCWRAAQETVSGSICVHTIPLMGENVGGFVCQAAIWIAHLLHAPCRRLSVVLVGLESDGPFVGFSSRIKCKM